MLIPKTRKILIIGPASKDGSFTGGAILAFESFLRLAGLSKSDHRFINSSKSEWKFKTLGLVMVMLKILMLAPFHNIICIHCTKIDTVTVIPLLAILKKVFAFKLITRKFGGAYHEDLQTMPLLLRKVIKFFLSSSNVNYFETKAIINSIHLQDLDNIKYLPNFRFKSSFRAPEKYSKRFVFISQVNTIKGIRVIIQAMNLLNDKSYTVDIFGTITEEKIKKELEQSFIVNYRGVLKAEQVCIKLSEYNFLLLPTSWKYEGHPGILIEALSVGVPFITTSVNNSILEVANHRVNSFVISPESPSQLAQAMESINQEKYTSLTKGALKTFSAFSAENYEHEVKSCLSCRPS